MPPAALAKPAIVLVITAGARLVTSPSEPLAKKLADGSREVVMALVTEEKGSDVSMGAHIVWDACHSLSEAAVVISNDSDLQTPVKMAMDFGLEVIVINPHRHRDQAIHLQGSDRQHQERPPCLRATA